MWVKCCQTCRWQSQCSLCPKWSALPPGSILSPACRNNFGIFFFFRGQICYLREVVWLLLVWNGAYLMSEPRRWRCRSLSGLSRSLRSCCAHQINLRDRPALGLEMGTSKFPLKKNKKRGKENHIGEVVLVVIYAISCLNPFCCFGVRDTRELGQNRFCSF